jgi:AcrR family transcriptional regulator
VWEPKRVVPSYAVPVEDISGAITMAASADRDAAPVDVSEVDAPRPGGSPQPWSMTYFIIMAKLDPPRERMIVSTALLIRERGARATSIDAVLEHSGAPRGSVYHHFPGGRQQLLREATAFSEEYVARRLQRGGGSGPLAAIEALLDHYRESLLTTDFRGGCPVVAVAIESSQDGPDLRDAALAAFERWRKALACAFQAAGVDAVRADELGMLVIAAFEGGLILSRTYRDLAPLETVHREVREMVQAELAQSDEET